MAITHLHNVGNSSSKTAGTSFNYLTPNVAGNNTAAGDIIVILIAKDNAASADGETSEVTSITDTKGNIYVKAKEFCNAQGSANAGATVSVWWGKTTAALLAADADSTTINFSSSITAKAASSRAFSVAAGNTFEVEASTTLANDGADPGSLDLTVADIEHLWIRVQAHEGPASDNFTKTAAYTTSTNGNGTTGGAAASNMYEVHEQDIFTGTSNPSNPSWDNARDEASILIAFKEITPATSTWPGWYSSRGGWF